MTLFFAVYFSCLIAYILGALILYWSNSSLYWDNLGKVRRTFYVLYLILLLIGMSQRYIDYKDWATLLILAGVSVFIDLAVFQNPNILKIMNAEFQHEDEVRKIIQKNKNALLKSVNKVRKFTEVVQYTDAHFDSKALPRNWEEYGQQLKEYLMLYAHVFGFRLSLFAFSPEEEPKEREAAFRQVMKNIETRHNKDFAAEEKLQHIRSFNAGEAASMEEDNLIAIPYYGEFHNFILTAEAQDTAVDWIDASHLLNLLYMFEWFMSDAESAADDETEENL